MTLLRSQRHMAAPTKGFLVKKLSQAEAATEAKRSMFQLQNGQRNTDLPNYNSNKNKCETVVVEALLAEHLGFACMHA